MDARKLKEKATEAFTKGKFGKAAELYADYCQADPKDTQARLRMGDAWAKAGDKHKAIDAYTSAAESFAKEGFLPRAIAASKLILELDPAHKGVQKMLAELYARKSGPGPAKKAPEQKLAVETKLEAPGTAVGFAARKDAIDLDAPAAEKPKPKVAPPGGAPAQAPSPLNRADAIELPEYDVPGAEIETASSGMVPAGKGPSPTKRVDAIELEDEAPVAQRAALEQASIELDVSVTGATPLAAAPVSTTEGAEASIIGVEIEESDAPAPSGPSIELEIVPAMSPPAPASAASARAMPPPPPAAPREPKLPAFELSLEDAPDFSMEATAKAAPVEEAAETSAPPGLLPKRATVATPPAPEPPPSEASGRIWIPGASQEAETSFSDVGDLSEAANDSVVPPRASPGRGQTDLEKSLAAFSRFDADDFASPVAQPPPPPAAAAAVAPAVAAPQARVRMPSFAELELEGDSLLHAVETAAQVGMTQRGHEVSSLHAGEELMEAPEDLKPVEPGALPKIPLFSDLSEDAFIALFERCPLKRVAQGELVFQQGSLGDAFYVICSGAVKVFRIDADRRRELATLEEGAFFGEMALLSGAPRMASVEGVGEETQLLEISAPTLTQLSHAHPQVATALKKFCRQRLLSNVMNSSPLFAPFSRSDRRDLVQRFRARDVQKGEALIHEGQRSDGMYVILSGDVEVRVGKMQVASLKEGDIFGEMSLLTKAPATASCVAGKRTSLLRLPREDFDQIILSHPQILMLVSDLTDERKKKNAVSSSTSAPMV